MHDAFSHRWEKNEGNRWKTSKVQVDFGHIAAVEPMTIYRKTHRNKLFFSSVDHLGKWWKIPRFLPFKLWILPYLILTGNPIERIRFIGKLEPFPNRFLVLWTPEKSANEAIHDFLLFNCIRILRISSSVSSFVSQICPFENALVNPNIQ